MRLRVGLGVGVPMYEIRCIFCKRIHRSEFFDEIEEEILSCRDRAPEWQKGRLDTYEDPHLKPISPESTAYAAESTSYAAGYV